MLASCLADLHKRAFEGGGSLGRRIVASREGVGALAHGQADYRLRARLLMAYPGRPVLTALPEFQGSATVRQSAEQRARLLAFAAEQYQAGRSLRQIAELTDRSQSAVRRALRQAGVQSRASGAPSTTG